MTQQQSNENLIAQVIQLLRQPYNPTNSLKTLLPLWDITRDLLWSSQGTRLDITVTISMLVQHQNKPYPGYIGAIRHILKYLKGTQSFDVCFHSNQDFVPETFGHFPINTGTITLLSGTYCRPLDQSKPKPHNMTEF